MSAVPSLKDFAAPSANNYGCIVCDSPYLSEVNEGRKAGISLPNIEKWLRLKGLPVVTRHRVERHFRDHVND